jgi:Protein of unknown function (DUF559)
LGNYSLDFVCFEHRLVVEIDGPSHQVRQQRLADEMRSPKVRSWSARSASTSRRPRLQCSDRRERRHDRGRHRRSPPKRWSPKRRRTSPRCRWVAVAWAAWTSEVRIAATVDAVADRVGRAHRARLQSTRDGKGGSGRPFLRVRPLLLPLRENSLPPGLTLGLPRWGRYARSEERPFFQHSRAPLPPIGQNQTLGARLMTAGRRHRGRPPTSCRSARIDPWTCMGRLVSRPS